jgi:hypothetical protein
MAKRPRNTGRLILRGCIDLTTCRTFHPRSQNTTSRANLMPKVWIWRAGSNTMATPGGSVWAPIKPLVLSTAERAHRTSEAITVPDERTHISI